MLLRCRAIRQAVMLPLLLACGSSLVGAQDSAANSGATPQKLPEITAEPVVPVVDPLIAQVDEAIRLNGQRFLTANYHSPWQIFHGVLAYRQDFLLKVGEEKMSAIQWIATADPKFDNRPLFLVSPQGVKFHPYTRPYAFEGHPSQTLALLSESRLPADFTFQASGQTVTISQLLQSSMLDVNNREETTWVLWALINYFDVDTQWNNRYGQAWSMEALVRAEVAAHTPTRPCGGNHNLFALSRARDRYAQTGRPLRGVWFEADQKIRQYVEYARSMQNSDGSFSSNFYKGPGYSNDMNTRFNTSGHTMEFLSVGLPAERLNEPWVRNAVNMLSRELIQHRRASVDCGPLYHSLNGLKIYRDRVAPPPAPVVATATPVATDPASVAASTPETAMASPQKPAATSTLPPPSRPLTPGNVVEETTAAKPSLPKASPPRLPTLVEDTENSPPTNPASALAPLNAPSEIAQ